MLQIEDLRKVHNGYAEYLFRWDYYMRSYMGAEEYRDGAYLRKYIAEDQAPGNQYKQRLLDTALQNHVKQTVDAYRSFIFRNEPTRSLGKLVDDPFVMEFKENADLDGTELDHFMREVMDMVIIYGGSWVGVDRPSYQVDTLAQEIDMGIRAFTTLYNPTNVRNWRYERMINGKRKLTYICVVDESYADYDVLRCWYPDRVEVYTVSKKDYASTSNGLTYGDTTANNDNIISEYGEILNYEEFANPLGWVPFIHVQSDKSFHKGIGTSPIGDVCDIQREIYNLTSELYQSIRLSSHPSIVAEPSTEVNGGAGAIITVTENTNIQPYLLQPTGASVESILNAIQQKVDAINEMTHLSAIKAVRNTPQSGVSLQVEREMLNAKLSDYSMMIEDAEKKIWKMFFAWQDIQPDDDFHVEYEDSFDLRDKHADLELYKKALELVPHNSFQHYIHDEIARLLITEEEDLQPILDEIKEDHASMGVTVPGEGTV